ncbi:glycerophosphodiester phosphodiesterase [Propionibacteriaceae bacterium Y2011]|uniref:glycerophosphodiester phosphodiesterase n=1 Tax=Microlunatus sp. Y2014 TaxID=3418488 RepID=UPI003B44D7EE
MVELFAHRGWSGAHPEMTRGAFVAAIDLARREDVRLGLECDVHFTADGRLGCLHDADLVRTGRWSGEPSAALADLSLAELRTVDFGAWRSDLADLAELTEADRAFVELSDLFDMVAEARAAGVDVHLAVETKHPVPHDDQVEGALAELLGSYGWADGSGPVRMISFDLAALDRMRASCPRVPLTYLISRPDDGTIDHLPGDIAVGPAGTLLRDDPAFVTRLHEAGRECHVWTVNEPADIAACLALGVDAITTDHPDRALAALDRSR